MRHLKLLTGLLALAASPAFAQEATCTAEQDGLKAVTDKYAAAYAAYQQEGEDLKAQGVALDADVTWADTEMVFDTPTVTVRDQRLVFGVPQVTLAQRDIIFGTPSVRMERVKGGQYPEVFCEDTWIHLFGGKTKGVPKCTVRWSDIWLDVPVPFMEEQRITMGIPEFTFDDTEVIMGVPEFSMERQRWVTALPQFTVHSVLLNAGDLKAEADQMQSRVAVTRENQQRDSVSAVHGLFSCYRDRTEGQRRSAAAMFNVSISQLDGVITTLTDQGADPSSVPAAGGQSSDLIANRARLIEQRDTALAGFDTALATLDASEKTAIEQLTATTTPAT